MHFIEVCSCGVVLSQCRCYHPEKRKTVRRNGCAKCKEAAAAAAPPVSQAEPAAEPPKAPSGPVLIPVSPGEALDRLLITQLKREHATDAERRRVLDEQAEALRAALRPYQDHCPGLLSDELDSPYQQLHHVNNMLWKLEDEIRRLIAAGDFGGQFVHAAYWISQTNDARAQLKREFDQVFSSDLADEKVYATSTGA